MARTPPKGALFSQTYLERGKASADSVRMRARLGAYVSSELPRSDELAPLVRRELGTDVPYGFSTYLWDEYFAKQKLRDVLDTITLAWRVVHKSYPSSAKHWVEFSERVFREENCPYTVDDQGGVHFFADEELERSRASTLAGLGRPKYAAAAILYESAFDQLAGATPDTNGAIRGVFEACETVFKLLLENKPSRLGSAEVNKLLKPLLSSKYQGHNADAAKLMASALAEWTNAAHQYRHAPGIEEPAPAPLDIALVMISGGASYIRWLISLDTPQS